MDKTEDYGKDYCIKIGKKVLEIMKKRNLTQNDIVALCKQAGASISQGTISNMKKGGTSISSIANICKGLNISISEILPDMEKDNDIQNRKDEKKTVTQVDLTTDIAYRGYLGDYHVYFFPTISNKFDLLHGILKIFQPEKENICKVSMKLFTGDKKIVNGITEDVVKEYEGEFIISLPMQSGYCILRNSLIDEQCFFVFHHWHILNNELQCRMAAVATTSAGGNRRPTIHRLYMSRCELSVENQKYIRGQLRLNDSEILISKANYAKLLEEENIPEEFKEIFEKEAKLESYYSVTESKLVNCDILEKDFAQTISLLRDYSAAARYNKVSMKTDEFIYNYYQAETE